MSNLHAVLTYNLPRHSFTSYRYRIAREIGSSCSSVGVEAISKQWFMQVKVTCLELHCFSSELQRSWPTTRPAVGADTRNSTAYTLQLVPSISIRSLARVPGTFTVWYSKDTDSDSRNVIVLKRHPHGHRVLPQRRAVRLSALPVHGSSRVMACIVWPHALGTYLCDRHCSLPISFYLVSHIVSASLPLSQVSFVCRKTTFKPLTASRKKVVLAALVTLHTSYEDPPFSPPQSIECRI
jgi:hypothetical protein